MKVVATCMGCRRSCSVPLGTLFTCVCGWHITIPVGVWEPAALHSPPDIPVVDNNAAL